MFGLKHRREIKVLDTLRSDGQWRTTAEISLATKLRQGKVYMALFALREYGLVQSRREDPEEQQGFYSRVVWKATTYA